MKIIELRQREEDQPKKDHPGLPSVELVMVVGNGPNEKFDCGLCNEQTMRREDTANCAIGHASNKSNTQAGSRVDSSEEPHADYDKEYDEEGSKEPY